MFNFLAKMIGRGNGREVAFSRGENNKLALAQAGLRSGMWVALADPFSEGTAIGIVTGCTAQGVVELRLADEKGENLETFPRLKLVGDLRQAYLEEIPRRPGTVDTEHLRALGYKNRSEA